MDLTEAEDITKTWQEYTDQISHSVVSDSLQPHGLGPTRHLHPWDFPGKNTGVGHHFLLQEIFLTQGLNPSFLPCGQTLYHLVAVGVGKSEVCQAG